MSNRVTFIIPGLLDPVPYLDKLPNQELPELSNFSTILSRGKWSVPESLNDSDNCFYDCLLDELPLQLRQKQAPIAGVTLLYDREKFALDEVYSLQDSSLKGKWVMRADPCFMTADRDQLLMARTQDMDLSMLEAKQLVDAINDFFTAYTEESFWKLYALTPNRWYIVSDKAIEIQTVPPEKVLGQSLKDHLLTGKDSQHWLNLFNEWQMILHQSPVNKQRLAEKKLPVNSVWFWGEGQAFELSSRIGKTFNPETQPVIYSNNVYAKGLAKIAQLTALDLPEKYQIVAGNPERQYLYIIEEFMQALYNRDVFSWVGLLKQLETNFLEPLLKEIKSGDINQVEFVSPSGRKLLLTRRLLRRWWRKKQPFYIFLMRN